MLRANAGKFTLCAEGRFPDVLKRTAARDTRKMHAGLA